MKRHHELKVGEVVFDLNSYRAGIVEEIRGTALDSIIVLSLHDERPIKFNKDYFFFDENDKGLPDSWSTENRYVYQFADGYQTAANGDPVCWEHCKADFEDEYPFYCPVTDENYFAVECERTNDPFMSEIADWCDEFSSAFDFKGDTEEEDQALNQYIMEKTDGAVWDTTEFVALYPQAEKYLRKW